MDNSNSLFGKFTKLRKNHQQPLTDLTELYSKIANETIYYKKLEDSKNYNKALQGWKALTTDALFQLTNINYTYPDTENYTVDELSILSGVRELYHKAQIHLDDLQKMLRDNPELSSRLNIKHIYHNTRGSYHSKRYKNSLTELQINISSPSTFTSSQGFSKTTLRDNDVGERLHGGEYSRSLNGYSNGPQRDNDVKVNFTNSMQLNNPLVHNNLFNGISNDNQSSVSTYSTETNPFENFDDDNDDNDDNNIPSDLAMIDGNETPDNNLDIDGGSYISVSNESTDQVPNNEISYGGGDDNGEEEADYKTQSDSEDLDFDVSEYYEDNYETIENQNEQGSRKEYSPSASASASSLIDDQDEYLYLDEEDEVRLQAVKKLNESPDKYVDLNNSQLTQELSHLCLSPSKLLGINKDNKKTKFEAESLIPPIPDKLPPPLPQISRVPVIVPTQITPEMKPQRHNLLNKNMAKNISAPSIRTTAASTQLKSPSHVNTDLSTNRRPIVKSNKSTYVISTSSLLHSSNVTLKNGTTHKPSVKSNKVSPSKSGLNPSKMPIKKRLVKHSKLSVESDRIKNNVSASQVAKLV